MSFITQQIEELIMKEAISFVQSAILRNPKYMPLVPMVEDFIRTHFPNSHADILFSGFNTPEVNKVVAPDPLKPF